MNKNYIVLDIETLPNPDLQDWFKEYINCRIEKKRGDNKDPDKYCQVSCAEGGRIFCIALGVNGKDFVVLKGTEEEVLRVFWDYMKACVGYRIVGFNSKGFDVPYISKRSCILGIDNYGIIIPTRKYYADNHYDLLEVLSNNWGGEMHSLAVCCKMYGVTYDNIDTGGDLLEHYKAGEYEKIYTKCLNDIKATDLLYNKILKYM